MDMIFLKRIYSFLLLLIAATTATAQDKPIGYWEAHLPYNTAMGVTTDGNMLYVACTQAFFTYNPANQQINTYSKVDGMSDVGLQCVGYDQTSGTAILVYQNGNIDLFKDNTFYNIPDYKLKTVAGSKAVYQIYTENGKAYLSTTLGVLVIDLVNKQVSATYQFIVNNQFVAVNGFASFGSYYYTITPAGMFRAMKSNPELQNFQVWQYVDSIHKGTHAFTSIAAVDSNLYLSKSDSVFAFMHDTLHRVYASTKQILNIEADNNKLFVAEYQSFAGDVKIIDSTYHVIDSFTAPGKTVQVINTLDGGIWLADAFNGLLKRTDVNQVTTITPDGPGDPNSYDIYVKNKQVVVAHGGYSDIYTGAGNTSGMSVFDGNSWKQYRDYSYGPFGDTIRDIVTVAKDEADGTIYAGSFNSGLFALKTDGSYTIYKQNSFLDPSQPNPTTYEVIGLKFDANDNLWLTMFGSAHELYVKPAGGDTWYKYAVPSYARPYPFPGGPMVIDDNGQVWYASVDGGGVIAYNPNGTFADPTDDLSIHFTTGVGFGNLPSNHVFSVAKDNTNNIWVGTDNGIGIISGCTATIANEICDAQIPIVQYDQFAGYLFAGESVHTITVDGGNRKWVGTDNGVWLLSPDASKIVYRFTQDNSPLPSNHIQKISIDGITGDVYIGTDAGLMTYRSTAVDGGTTNSNVITYPNPVPSGYTGTIAIKGLVANADVRITDIDGQLVYRTIALGGQAVWNGMDYKGHRPQSGVYLIFVTNSDGTETYTGKMVFMQ